MSNTVLPDLLADSATRDGAHPAVQDGDRVMSYSALDQRTNQLARLLLDRGVQRGDRVGVYLEKSLDAVVAIYGTLKAGAAYVPLDPFAPVARLAYIARNADLRCLLTGRERGDTWPGLIADGAPVDTLIVLNARADDATLTLDDVEVMTGSALDVQDPSATGLDLRPSDLAYILYTSGSTGEPKGVMLSHRNALGFVDWAAEQIGVTAADRASSHAPLHFDLSVFDLYATARAGATLVLVPPELSMFPVELARFIEHAGITVWYSVPSVLSMLVVRGGLGSVDLNALRAIIFAGEVFPPKYLFRLMQLVPHASFHNWYGPTETNVCTAYTVASLDVAAQEIPIGRPISGVDAYPVTDDGERASPGNVGELHVTGPTVMQGYWGDPERSARSLTLDSDGGWPTYRTGDLVVQRSDGNFLYLGRRDSQIKSRGHRIELGEIEAVLQDHPSVVECAVAAIPDELVTNRIKAYVVAQDDTDAIALGNFCATRVPRHMVPEIFELVERLPRSSTGKIARTELEAAAASRKE